MYVLVNINDTSKAETETAVFHNFDELYNWVLQKKGTTKVQQELAAGVVSKLQSFLGSLLPQGSSQTQPASLPVIPAEETVETINTKENMGTLIDFGDEQHDEDDSELNTMKGVSEQQQAKPLREIFPLLKGALGSISEPYNSQYFNKKISQVRTDTYEPNEHIPAEMIWLQSENAMIPTAEVTRMSEELKNTYFKTFQLPSSEDKESVDTSLFMRNPKIKFNLKGESILQLGHLCPAVLELKNWFISTFCEPIKQTDTDIHYTTISFKACVTLFLNAPEFCIMNPYMVPSAVAIPPSAMKYLNDYELEPLFNYIAYDNEYKIKKDYFNLFFDILKNVRKDAKHEPSYYLSKIPRVVTPMSSFLYENFDNWECLISETLVNYGKNKLTKNTLKDWIIPFVSHELKETEGSSTKSSEIYALWNSFLKNVVKNVKDQNFVVSFTESVSIQQFSKSMKAMGFEIVRKSAGMFYQGLEKRENAENSVESNNGYNVGFTGYIPENYDTFGTVS
jgi:hypothetical protein